MSSPSPTDTSGPEAHDADRPGGSAAGARPPALVISARADDKGAVAAARWAARAGHDADAVVSSAADDLEARLAAAGRVLVLDPSPLAAWRGFGARAGAHDRLALMARLGGRREPVTWACTPAQAARWDAPAVPAPR